MRTPLLCKLRVTISPWNSWPDFLKVPIFAISLLLGCSSPRPSRPRWRSAGRRRSPPHPSSGRSAAEDGGGATFLAREEWAKPRGRKSRRRRCGTAIEAQPSFGQIKPSEAARLAVWQLIPRRRRGGYRSRKGSGSLGAEKETPACRWTAAGCRDQTGQRLKTIDWRGLRRRAWSKPTRDRTQVMRGDQRDRLAWAHFRDGKFAPRRSATLADEAMPDWQQRPARHRAGERATCALWPSPRRWSRPQLQ